MTDHKLRFHNTFTGKEEPFKPLSPGTVQMYVCGVTPYDECHLGHARCYVAFDFIRRALTRLGYAVTHIQNFTDVDDKIIARANERQEDPKALSQRYIADYFDKMDKLNVQRADKYPLVTENIPAIVALIEKLVAKGLAYALDGGVYYSIRKFPPYGKLSKREPDDLVAGARVEVDKHKEDPLDFALWKAAKPGEPSWPSPWGPGRPGWHIECSAMSLGSFNAETFDIHGGGQDLIFPHHENEIAQSEGATGKTYARYWIHNGFVTVNKEKMSKSLGNFFSLGDIFKKFEPRTVRFFLLGHHYRSPVEFSDDLLGQAAAQLQEIDEDLSRMDAAAKTAMAAGRRSAKELDKHLDGFAAAIDEALADNFNSPRVLAVVFALLGELKTRLATPKSLSTEALVEGVKLIRGAFADVLGIPVKAPPVGGVDGAVEGLLQERAAARKTKNWKESDRLREVLAGHDIVVEDTPQGQRWWKKT